MEVTRWVRRPAAEKALAKQDTVKRHMEYARRLVVSGQKRLCPVAPVGDPTRPSGTLRSHVTSRLYLGPRGWEAHCGVFGDPVWLFVEFGTAPHLIESKGEYPLRNAKGQVFGRRVNHPGTRAQPFIRPGLGMIRGRVFKG